MSLSEKIDKVLELAESLSDGKSSLPILLGAITMALGRSGDPLFNADVVIVSMNRAKAAIERVLAPRVAS